MTKVYKLSDDMYKFVNEDSGTARTFNSILAQKEFDELNKTPSDAVKKQQRNTPFYEIESFFQTPEYLNNKSKFESALKQLKDVKEFKFKTNEKAFNSERYDKFKSDCVAEFNQTTSELNDIMNSSKICSDECQRKYRELLEHRRELQSRIQLTNKSENQFYDDVYKTVKTSPFEAYNTVNHLLEHQKEADKKAQVNAVNKLIEREKSQLAWIKSEDDFQLIKRLYSMIDSHAFFDMFEKPHRMDNRLTYVVTFDSLNEFFNRDRGDIPYDMPELVLSDTEYSIVAFASSVISKIRHDIYTESLQSEIAAEIAHEITQPIPDK